MSVPHMCASNHGDQKRALFHLELKLQNSWELPDVGARH